MTEIPLPNPSPAEGERGNFSPASVPLPHGRERESEAKLSRERGPLRSHAKRMRSEQTPAEHRLWQILRAKRLGGYKFNRQVPIDGYIVDFVCLGKRLIIEADGGQHSESDYDIRRDTYLKAQGFRILRFWNNDIFDNEEGVLTSILNALTEPLSPTPLPLKGRGANQGQSPAEGERGYSERISNG